MHRAPEIQLPWPPFSCAARLASWMAWYSGVSGASWALPHSLVGSNGVCVLPPRAKIGPQIPLSSGYFASSKASAGAVQAHIPRMVSKHIDPRRRMVFLLLIRPGARAVGWIVDHGSPAAKGRQKDRAFFGKVETGFPSEMLDEITGAS